MFRHEHFEISQYVKLTLKDGSEVEGRIADLYHSKEEQYVTIVKPGSLFHNPIALAQIKSSQLIK